MTVSDPVSHTPVPSWFGERIFIEAYQIYIHSFLFPSNFRGRILFFCSSDSFSQGLFYQTSAESCWWNKVQLQHLPPPQPQDDTDPVHVHMTPSPCCSENVQSLSCSLTSKAPIAHLLPGFLASQLWKQLKKQEATCWNPETFLLAVLKLNLSIIFKMLPCSLKLPSTCLCGSGHVSFSSLHSPNSSAAGAS